MAATTSSTTARENFVEAGPEITGGEGVDVVYDSVGKDTFPGSLDCLRPMGMWVSFGQSSGLPPAFPTSMLQQKGSLFATRPTIAHYLAKRPDLEAAANELFAVLRSGTVRGRRRSGVPAEGCRRGPPRAGGAEDRRGRRFCSRETA